jgi:hypothetical protein
MAFSVTDLLSGLNKPKETPVQNQVNSTAAAAGLEAAMDLIYDIESQNWYTAKPYGFKATNRDGGVFTMFLPISPSNLNITTNFATNVIPTLYGTVEEHSDVRYYDITIEGTTGMAPKFVEPGVGEPGGNLYGALQTKGRTAFSVAQGISLGGFFSKTLGAVNQIANKATDLLQGAPKPKAGVYSDNSGYVAFHNLYRFLLQYKKDTTGAYSNTKRTSHPLTFFNYKDNNQYDVVVRNFVLRRSVQDPMLYYYSIQLRAYNLRPITSPIDEDLTQRLKDLGLNGVNSSSLLGDIKSLSSGVKSIIGSAVGGISVLGR